MPSVLAVHFPVLQDIDFCLMINHNCLEFILSKIKDFLLCGKGAIKCIPSLQLVFGEQYISKLLIAIKKNPSNAICSNIDGTGDSHNKSGKSERENQIPYDITYMWNLKYGTDEPIY